LDTVKACCRQSATSEEDNKHLSTYGNKINTNEVPVAVEAFEDIELIVEAAIAVHDLGIC
jgi:hypothetical protein